MSMSMSMSMSLSAFACPTGRSVLLLLTLILARPTAIASVQTEDSNLKEVRSWLDHKLVEEYSLDDIAPVHIVLWSGPSVSDEASTRARYNALSRKVAGKPEHPDREEYERLREALFDSGGATRVELFIAGDLLIRKNETYADDDGTIPFYDTVMTPNDAWSITKNRITRVDPSHGFPKESNFSGMPITVWHMCGFIVDGGLHMLAHRGARVVSLRRKGDLFVAEAETTDGAYRSRIEVRWDGDAGEGRVLSQQMVRTSNGESAGSWKMDEMRYSDELARWITTSWFERLQTESMPTKWVVDVVERVPVREIRNVMRCPTLDTPDSIRGAVPVLFDFRHDSRGRVAALMPGVEIPEGRLPIKSEYSRTRWFATAGAVFVVLSLVTFRIRKKTM